MFYFGDILDIFGIFLEIILGPKYEYLLDVLRIYIYIYESIYPESQISQDVGYIDRIYVRRIDNSYRDNPNIKPIVRYSYCWYYLIVCTRLILIWDLFV